MTPKGNNKLAKANKPVVKTPVKSILKDTKSPARQNNKSVKIDSKVKVSQKKGKKKFEEEEDDDDDDDDDIEQDIEDDNEADDDDNEVDEDDDNEINDEEEENDDDEEEEEDVINIPKNNKRKQEVQSTPSKKTKVEVNKNNKASSGTNRIFIRNISRQTEEKDLYQFLRNNGLNPIDVSVPRKPDGSSKGFGFAGFSNQNELEKAVALDGSELNGSTLSIAVSNDPRESQKTKTLLIKNLSSDVDEETLSSHFSGSTGCRIITYNGVSKGFGFVDFSSEAEAENALNQFQGTTINNQQIYVAYAQPKNSDRKPFNNNFGENNRQNSNNSFNNKRGGSNNRGNFRGGNRGNFRGGDRGNFRGGNRGGFKGNNRSHQKFDD